MKKLLYLTFAFLFSYIGLCAQEKAVINPIEVITGKLIKSTKSLKDFTAVDEIPFVRVRDEKGIIGKKSTKKQIDPETYKKWYGDFKEDPALQKNGPSLPHQNAVGAIVNDFDGKSFTGASPADPTLCVGPNHIIQMVNGNSGAVFTVFDKTGNILVPTTNFDAVTGKGGLGDPIALYDQLADRFILTEFVNSFETGSEGLSIAVSQTADPTGAWFVYFFSTGTAFPDYPKFSVWNNAYYAVTHDFINNRSQFIGCSVYAFDRDKMIAGDQTATVQKFLIGGGAAERELSMCPVLLQGTSLPPAGTGGLIAYMADANWTGSATNTDSIGMFEFKPNFTTPALSTLTTRASLEVQPFIPFVGFNFGFAATQPGSNLLLDVVNNRVMNQPVYRNFGDHEGIVMAHVVDQGAQISGIRWYELIKTTGNWAVRNQSTFGPDNTFRYIPAIAYDAAGNIGLAYNVSSSDNTIFPGLRYTGRRSCDPVNTMTLVESSIINGSSPNGGNRRGDYNHMVCDPDGVRFWFTAEYNNSIVWNTRISSFTIENCAAAVCGDPTNLATANITSTSSTVSWSVVPNALTYDVELQLNGTTAWTRMATGIATTTFEFIGLGPNQSWNWRVKANCPAGAGNFAQSAFTTLTACNGPNALFDLFSFDVFATSASVSWIPGGTNELSYLVEYKLNSSTTWLTAGTTNTTFINITGLLPNSLYDWRVTTTCAGGISLPAASQFTTLASVSCQSIYDNVPNGNFSNAQLIPLNTDISGKINIEDDEDYYRFSLSSTGNVVITLKTLPANYDIRLYNNNRSEIARSEKRGKNDELITRRLSPGNYFIKVYGKDDAHNNTNCYTLKVASRTGTNSPEHIGTEKLQVYPSPVDKTLHVVVKDFNTSAVIQVIDMNGRILLVQQTTQATTALDIHKLTAGVYIIKVTDANGRNAYQTKFLKQ